jgi:acetoin utilization deacetylase AcuC-like enzyme
MIDVFYNEAMHAENPNAYSPSASKPKYVVADWKFQPDIAPHVNVRPFRRMSPVGLSRVHDSNYVYNVLNCIEPNGFGNKDPEVAQSLLHTTGSMYMAAGHAKMHGIAVSPTSGFHHAHYDSGGGFCTFNALALVALQYGHPDSKVLILDFDQHYGDGTEEILNRMELNDCVSHITAGKSYRSAAEALKVTREVDHMLKTGIYGLVVFQAGADMWEHDPLGGLMSLDQLRERDHNVFSACKRNDVPCVMNLAGGYAKDAEGTIEPVLAIHRQTMRELISVYC